MRFQDLTLSRKFSAITLLFVAGFILTMLLSIGFIVSLVLSDYFDNEVRDKARIVLQTVEQMKQNALNATEWFQKSSRILRAYRSGDRAGAIEIGKSAMRSFNMDYFAITDSKGNIFIRAHAPEKYGDNISNQTNIKNALAGKRTVAIEEGAVVKYSVRAGTPLTDENGAVIGAISTGFVLTKNDFVDAQKKALGCDVTVFHGIERVSTSLIRNGKRLTGTRLEHKKIIDLVLKAGKEFYGSATILDRLYHTAYLPIRDSSGKVSGILFIGKDASVISDLSWRLRQYYVVIFLILGGGFVFAMIKTVQRLILGRISATAAILADIAEGQGDLTGRLDASSTDEIGDLARNFNIFADKIQEMVRDIRDIAQNLATASEELSWSTTSFSESAQSQAASVEEVNATTEELAAGMEHISANTHAEFDAAETLSNTMKVLSDAIRKMGASIDETLRLTDTMSSNAKSGNDSLNLMTETMRTITESSGKVSSILEIINGISEQINLLSLNAAIESARAGEAGRGFAVVADEISKLADQTAQSLKEIGSLIKVNDDEISKGQENVEETNRIIRLIIEGVSAINKMMDGISGSMNAQRESNESMQTVVDNVRHRTQEINNATDEHLRATDEIVKSTGLINEKTQSIASGAEELASTAEEITAMAENLNSKIEFFKV